ncbi:MAG: site-specific integrase [Firmicutes bacterium]|nr:site-specific integrase [Bacillota bacterium]
MPKARARKDGRYVLTVSLGKGADGNYKRKDFYGKSPKECEAEYKKFIINTEKGIQTDISKMTYGEWLDTWLNDYMKDSIRATTWASYETQVRKHIKPALGDVKLQKVQADHVQKLLREKQQDGARVDGQKGKLSSRSVRYIYTVIHASLEHAVKTRKLAYNPCDGVKLPAKSNGNENKKLKVLTAEDLKKLLDITNQTRHNTLIQLALQTGLRRGELLGLKWTDINYSTKTLTVNRNLVRIPKEGLGFQKPKNGKTRIVGLTDSMIKELENHGTQQLWEKKQAEKSYQDDGLIFCTEEGKPIDPRAFNRYYEQMLKKAELPHMGIHSLRHTFTELAYNSGVDIKTISEILGHHSTAFTMDIYQHLNQEMLDDSAKKIDKMFQGIAN